MKFMKLGTRPDTFYTEEATRTVISDLPSDLTIQINNITYLLHKLQFPLLPKCGLLQRLCSDISETSTMTLELDDIPGGEDAFELCAKYCYGITINLSAHSFVSALCAAKFLQMTEAVDRGNLILKLEAFFNSCILEGWKDSIITLQTTGKLPEWSESLGVVRRCIDSVVEKIPTPPAKVIWSYTYTRPGYVHKRHQSVPRDWWTEDIADLDIDLFRCIVTTVRSTNILPPQLIGEALHVYAYRWLPDITKGRPPESSAAQTEESMDNKRRVLETIVNMIPADPGSVSVAFLLRLLSLANLLGVSPVTKTELINRTSLKLEEMTLADLLLPSHTSNDGYIYDSDLVGAILESFMMQWRRRPAGEHNESLRLIRKVGRLIDSYIQVVAKDVNMPVQKVVSLAEALPAVARIKHDDLYKAINIYLKEHPDLTKAEKKNLCRILDCQKLSPEVCAHAVKNERLPLRTVVQVLFFEQEKGARATNSKLHSKELEEDDLSKLKLGSDEQSIKAKGARRTTTPGISEQGYHGLGLSDGKLQLERDHQKSQVREIEPEKRNEIREEGTHESKLNPKKKIQQSSKSESRDKGRER
ncbi:hypothetical protein RJ639_017227 [Escallonia herrerae]|uniref:NPH3 domain-containing protein n=1 Tax=Escallonia herrerae TaxID=1293975 RepID=A0AA88VF41_9ASTE|nr:hypothetical protein RJ639_017227 [Escallonia herrerae]